MSGAALVFGANGISGTACIAALAATPASQFKKIIAISRRPPQQNFSDDRITFLSIDLLKLDVEDIKGKLADVGGADVTHIYHYTYIAKQDEQELVDVNKELFGKALDAVKGVCKKCKVFLLQTGYKYYGVHKGPPYLAPIPFVESAPRHEGLNFYYIQEDMLRATCTAEKWNFVITRPNFIIGIAKGNYMNLAVTIALYAVVQKELGNPLFFPGNQIMYESIADHSAASNNSKFQVWASLHEKCWDRAFNIHDGKKIRFQDLWPKIAEYFGLSLPTPLFVPDATKEALAALPPAPKCQLSLADYMPKQKDVWDRIASKHSLDTKAFDYATWDFGDFACGRVWPDDGDMSAARGVGWDVTIDSWEDGWKQVFEELKKDGIIPK